MNTARGRLWMMGLLLAGLTVGPEVRAEDSPTTASAPAVAATNAAVSFTLSPPTAPATPGAAAAPSVAEIPPVEPVAPVTDGTALVAAQEVQSAGLVTDFGLSTPGTDTGEGDAETQRRLQAPTPEEIIEQYGSVGFLIREPEPRNFLELINPFAPEEFGPREREVYNRDPNLRPGATLPRTFINDITHEPVMSFWNWAW